MKLYLAGPDVFRPDAVAWAAAARVLCRRFGFEALTPLDHDETDPARIFQGNLVLIRKAQIIVANLDPFRGAEPDSGTAFELGYALALGKKLYGYLGQRDTVLARVQDHEGLPELTRSADGKAVDRQGMLIEDSGLPLNLMLAMSTSIVEGTLEDCLRAIRPHAAETAERNP